MAQMTENEIKDIVKKVLGQMQNMKPAENNWDSTQYGGRKFIGIYEA